MTDSEGWEEERFTLQRLLVRTSLVAEGQDPDLDRILDELRDAVRGGCELSLLKLYQLQLDQALSRLDKAKAGAGSAQVEALNQLLHALQRDYTGYEARKSLKNLKKQAAKSKGDHSGMAGWLAEVASVITQAAPPDAHSRSRGWQRFFSRDADRAQSDGQPDPDDPAAAPDSRDPHDLAPEPQMLSELEPSEPGPVARPRARDTAISETGLNESGERQRIAARVGELLEHILGQISLDSDAHDRALQLRAQLRTSDAWDDLRFALNEIVDLVGVAVNRGRGEFEDFLRRLDERLGAMKDTFNYQEQANAARRDAAELDQVVTTRLEDIGELVADSSDIHSLKSSVSQHLQAIAVSLSNYRRQEQQRDEMLEHQLGAMQERLAGMEAYSEQMQQQLSVERSRAMTDPLTQLPNRGAWQERLQFEYDRWTRYEGPVTLAILDIDYFKTVNDTYGHKVGDRVIQLVAKALQERLRKTDFVARYGGEEFVALLPETDLEQGFEAVDNLREHVASLPFHFQKKPLRITLSGGVVAFSGGAGPDAFFEKADRALYRAKDNGRNQIIRAD